MLLPLERALEIPHNIQDLRRLQEALIEAEAHSCRRRILLGQHRRDDGRLLALSVRHGQRHLRDRLRRRCTGVLGAD